jgi:hypothetical protein
MIGEIDLVGEDRELILDHANYEICFKYITKDNN